MSAVLTRAELLKGARLGAYEIVRPIGGGAMASVFEARHVALEKPVAVKVLHEHLANDAEVTARFLREGRIAAQLRHPNALDVIDLGEERGVAYLVMELLEGRDLRAHLAEHRPLSLAETIGYALPIVSALAHAHELGVVHRDIKPANVFLARDARGQIVPKLVDFGLSKIDGGEGEKPVTGSEIVAGTVSYMAPEQTYGVAKAGPAADQFSLAMTLYECLTGRVPFAAATFYQLIEEIRAALVKPPSLVVPGLPAELDDVLLRALARTPEKRWPTVRALGGALLPFADEATRASWGRDFGAAPAALRPSLPSPVRAAPAVDPGSASVALRAAPPASALPVPPGESPFRIKGLAYRGIALYADRVVPGGLAALLAALPDPKLRAFASQPFLASGRYDILPVVPLVVTIARLVRQPFETLVRGMAKAQARYDARKVFPQMIERVTLREFPSRMPRYGGQYYDFGPFSAECEGDWAGGRGAIVVRHAGLPEFVLPWYAPMQAGYFEELVAVLGGGEVRSERLAPVPGGQVRGLPVVTTGTRILFRH